MAAAIRCPTTRSWSSVFSRAGIGPESFVLALDDGSGWAARCWWLLRHVGHDRAGTLDLRSYLGPLSTAPVETTPAPFQARPRSDDTITAEEILARLGDARSRSSTRAAASAGSATRSRSTRSPAGSPARATPPSPSRSRTGAAAAPELVATAAPASRACVVAQRLILAGRDDVRVYPGSFSEWCRREGYPVEKGPA